MHQVHDQLRKQGVICIHTLPNRKSLAVILLLLDDDIKGAVCCVDVERVCNAPCFAVRCAVLSAFDWIKNMVGIGDTSLS